MESIQLEAQKPNVVLGDFLGDRIKKLLHAHFFRFCVVGVANTSFNYLIFYLCLVKLKLPLLFAGALGFAAAIGPAYLLNRAWSFKSDAPLASGLAKYLAINLFTLTVHLSIQWFVTLMLNIPAIWSQAFGIAVTTLLNFFLVRRFIFALSLDES